MNHPKRNNKRVQIENLFLIKKLYVLTELVEPQLTINLLKKYCPRPKQILEQITFSASYSFKTVQLKQFKQFGNLSWAFSVHFENSD